MLILIIVIALIALGIFLISRGAVRLGIGILIIGIFFTIYDFGAIKAIFVHDNGKVSSSDYIAKNGFMLDDSDISEETLIENAKEENKELAKEASDLKGKSKLEKMQMGLGPEDGSDTDGDGLTDKEEIEKYNSDPRKESTAGDLYPDGYKVEHGMDLNKKYDRDWKEVEVKNNKTDNVRPIITDLSQTFCSITDLTGIDSLKGQTVLAEYKVDDCKASLMIDTASVEKAYGIDQGKIAVYITRTESASKAEKMKTEVQDGNLVINPVNDSEYYSGYVFLTEKKAFGGSKADFEAQAGYDGADPQEPATGLFSSDAAKKVSDKYEKGYSLAFGCPLVAAFTHNLTLWYPDMGDKKKTSSVRKAAIKGATTEMEENPFDGEKNYKKKKKKQIIARYNNLKKLFPDCESTPDMPGRWQQIFFWYSLYDESGTSDAMRIAQKEKAEEEETIRSQTISGFIPGWDELPFQNFGDEVSDGGNCMGISVYTASLYNNKKYSATGGQNDYEYKTSDQITYRCAICGKEFVNKEYSKAREEALEKQKAIQNNKNPFTSLWNHITGNDKVEIPDTAWTAATNHMVSEHATEWNLQQEYDRDPVLNSSPDKDCKDPNALKPDSELSGTYRYLLAYTCREDSGHNKVFWFRNYYKKGEKNYDKAQERAKEACKQYKDTCDYYAALSQYNYKVLETVYNKYQLSYDLGKDDDNKTLLDLRLDDYKNKNFVDNNSKKNKDDNSVFDDAKLSDGEKEFIKMIEYNHVTGNNAYIGFKVSRPSYQDAIDNYKDSSGKQLTATDNQKQHLKHPYSYETINNIKKEIDNGHVVCLAMNKYGTSAGHVVVLYSYTETKSDSGMANVVFDVYGCNLPYERLGGDNKYTLNIQQTADGSFDYAYGEEADDEDTTKYAFAPYYGNDYGFHFAAFTSDLKSLTVLKQYKDIAKNGSLITATD